ncbi:MAG TPA: helix-turn-helix transcriptional regulator [Dermatophilaceae bacterium]|nr:helix-turn-helix transcriptional regulator [Dermatophilaceae bacterium]
MSPCQESWARHVELRRWPTGPAVARWVENHWSLAWDLPRGSSVTSRVLPHPTCSLTAEHASHPRRGVGRERVVVTGVVTRRFDVEVRGTGRVLGVRFRPGGLAALSGRSARAWTDAVVPASDVLPAPVCGALADPALADDPGAWAAVAEEVLAGIPAPDDAQYERVLEVVADLLADRTLLTVGEVAARHGLTPRTLQRLFVHYVGVGPKWVLGRYRMHDVVTELDEGYAGPLTELAARHGWYDQAHFTRDFTALVGVTPGQYRGGGGHEGAPAR